MLEASAPIPTRKAIATRVTDRDEHVVDHLQREIDAENHAFAEVRRLAHEIAKVAGPIAHIGGDIPFDGVLFMIGQILDPNYGQWQPQPSRKKKRVPATIRTAVYERDQYRCVTCGTWIGLSIDHIIPESRGGPTEIDNLQTLCRPCNSRKGDRVATATGQADA